MTFLYCNQGHENSADNRFCRLCGEALAAVAVGAIGQYLGDRYRVLRQLGQGGFGRTYLAEDAHRFNETCVLKEFAPQVQGNEALRKAEELFQREAGVLYRMQHPQIPRFREFFRADISGGRLFLVQDYVAGDTYLTLLRQRQQQGQTFTEPEVTHLLLQLLPVLTYIHSAGVVHRDISPDNLICRQADQLPVLIDFGGVKQIAATVISQTPGAVLPANPTVLGKWGYAPTEQMSLGEADPHSDLYALAMTVLVLLTGQEPQVLLGSDRRHWHHLVTLTPRLMTVLDRMLRLAPTQRYQSAVEVMQALGPEMLPLPDLPEVAPEGRIGAPGVPVTPTHLPTVAMNPERDQVIPVKQSSQRGIQFLGFSLLLVSIAVGGWYVGDRFLKPKALPPQPTASPPDNSDTANNIPPEPDFSPAEKARKQAIIQRRQALNINNETFLVPLVNEVFYAKNPIGRALNLKPEDANLRQEWDTIAKDYLDRLAGLSAQARAGLGSYTNADLETRRAKLNQLNLSSRALNDLTDAQFAVLLPEQPRQGQLSKPMMQIWQAIATDQFKALQTGKTLERIQFPTGQISQQTKGTLKPGQGKAYLVALSQAQIAQLRLQTASSALQLSFYPPSSQDPALLEDSEKTEWTGSLPNSGLYEIVVVSTARQSVSYTLDLQVENPLPAVAPTPTISPSPTPSI